MQAERSEQGPPFVGIDRETARHRAQLSAGVFIAELTLKLGEEDDKTPLQEAVAKYQQDPEYAREVQGHFSQLDSEMVDYAEYIANLADLEGAQTPTTEHTFLAVNFGITSDEYANLRNAFIEPDQPQAPQA